MTPAARLAAAIEVLDQIARHRVPADTTLKTWGKAHRFAGSKDRRAIAERVYAVLRARGRLAWIMGEDGGRALVLGSLIHLDGLELGEVAALFTGKAYGPLALSDEERTRLAAPLQPAPDWIEAGVPEFVADAFKAQFGADWLAEAQGLIGGRAPLDLRVNTLRGGVVQAMTLLKTDDLDAERTPTSGLGLRLPHTLAPDVQRLRAFKSGWVEVQDEASQIAAALADARPGMTVVDYCAGGGGKTLVLGAMRALASRPPVDPEEGAEEIAIDETAPEEEAAPEEAPGRLVACDINAKRLDAMRPRLERADVYADIRHIGPQGQGTEDLEGLADLVFVDAPCSGSGTWRRHPEAAWRLSPETVTRLAGLQGEIVARAARLVRPGGRLAYATCSVLAQENEAVAAQFAAAHPDFRPIPIAAAAQTAVQASALTEAGRARLVELSGDTHTLQMTPRRTGTDGFFIALFERSA